MASQWDKMSPEAKARKIAYQREYNARRKLEAARSPSTSTSESSSKNSPDSEESPPSLPPPRPTQTRTPQRTSSVIPPVFGETYRRVPEDEKERDEALKPYRFYGRALAGVWSKLLAFASDEPADAEEKDAAIEAITLACYQNDITMLDWRVSCALALGAPLVSRVPAIKKKWFEEKTLAEMLEQKRKVEKDMGTAVRLTTVPEATKEGV
jgi:hypothetical protein